MSATILFTCYASTEGLGLSELNDTNIISLGVPGRIFRAVESTNFRKIVLTLPHIMVPKFASLNYRSENIGRTCNGSGNVLNWETLMNCENPRVKAFGLPTSKFAFSLSQIAMQVQLITWQNLTSMEIPNSSSDYEVLSQGIPSICGNVGTSEYRDLHMNN